jgi:hypothetical protein
MSIILDEFDQLKVHSILGKELARKEGYLSDSVLNANAYRLTFLEDLPCRSTMLEKYKARLHRKGSIQEAKQLSEFSRLTLACNIQRQKPHDFD